MNTIWGVTLEVPKNSLPAPVAESSVQDLIASKQSNGTRLPLFARTTSDTDGSYLSAVAFGRCLVIELQASFIARCKFSEQLQAYDQELEMSMLS